MPKRTPEEILKAIEESDVDDEIERVLSMSDAERRAELRAAGYDIDEIHAEADAFHKKLLGSQVDGSAKRPKKAAVATAVRPWRRPRMLLLLAAALSAAVSVAVSIPTAVVVARHVAAAAPSAVVPPAAPSQGELMPETDVATLRRKALEACQDARWVECLYGLDRARHIDPAGDNDAVVKLARYVAADGLLGRQNTPPRMDAK